MKNISKLIGLLRPEDKYKFFTLIILTFISIVLEIFLLKFILMFFNYFSNPTINDDSQIFNLINLFTSHLSINLNFYIILIVFLFFIFLFKTSVNLFINWKKAKFVFETKEYLGRKFLNGYLFMPRIFHMRTNTSELIKNVTIEVDNFMKSLLAISNIILETILVSGIIVFLILVDYKIALTCFIIFFFFSMTISFLNSKQSINLGKERMQVVQDRLKNVIETLTGSKTYEITGLRNKAISFFDKNNKKLTKISIESYFRNTMPKPLFELFTILFITFFAVLFNTQSGDLKFILPKLAVFFTAAYRLIPSLSTILTNLQAYEYCMEAINSLSKDAFKFNEINDSDNSKTPFRKEIFINNISFSYDEKNIVNQNLILENLNLKISKGDKIGLIGESGSGKSTLLDILMGLLSTVKGEILIDGDNIKNNLSGWQKNIGCVPQDVFILDDSLKKNIAFGLDENDINSERIRKVLSESGLTNYVKNLPYGIETMVGERGERISGGQKQRIGIARALYLEPEILILDESTSALDEKTENSIVSELYDNNKSKTIIFASHNLKNLIYCDHVFKVENKTLKKIEIAKN